MRDYHFGEFLRELRTQRGLSQYQLGRLLGVSDKAVSNWENGLTKPRAGLLAALSHILGVRMEELLSGQRYIPAAEEESQRRQTRIREKAEGRLHELYGDVPPPWILNRYLSEWEDMGRTDTPLYLDLLGQLQAAAKERQESIRNHGAAGASFIAYLLGATDISPLPPHYYCPHCRKAERIESETCGWDLLPKTCTCGRALERDGHSLPYEVLRQKEGELYKVHISLSTAFHSAALEGIRAFHAPGQVVSLRRDAPNLDILVLLPGDIPLREGDAAYDQALRTSPRITLRLTEELDRLRELSEAVGVPLHRADIRSEAVLDAFRAGETEGIPEFQLPLFRRWLSGIRSRRDLIQLLGLSHQTGGWNPAETPLSECIAYREDVFACVQAHLSPSDAGQTGLAYRIMEDARRGTYAGGAFPKEMERLIGELGAEELRPILPKIRYLQMKSYGVERIRYALALMWYKTRYPAEFGRYFPPSP